MFRVLPIMLTSNRIVSADSARKFTIAIVTALPAAGTRLLLVSAGAGFRLLVVSGIASRPACRLPFIIRVRHLVLNSSPAAPTFELVVASDRSAVAVFRESLVQHPTHVWIRKGKKPKCGSTRQLRASRALGLRRTLPLIK